MDLLFVVMFSSHCLRDNILNKLKHLRFRALNFHPCLLLVLYADRCTATDMHAKESGEQNRKCPLNFTFFGISCIMVPTESAFQLLPDLRRFILMSGAGVKYLSFVVMENE